MNRSSSGQATSHEALIKALRHRDAHTEAHSSRVLSLSERLGRACGLGPRQLEMLELAARFHDLGKIGIPDEVLLKPGQLSAEERAVMEAHPLIGEDIVCALGGQWCREAGRAIRNHHERFDGTGYPDGRAGEAIPLLSRVITIADCYDAMTETRPYHPARSHSVVMDHMRKECGAKFDPALFRLFEHMLEAA